MVTGATFYEGPSLLDGSPIVAIATFDTSNQKTGNMVQTWILLADTDPIRAISSGEDAAICGTCPLRGYLAPHPKYGTTNKQRGCYVSVRQAPGAVYRAYREGKYPVLTDALRRRLIGKGLRLGSYGDPVAVPMENWDVLAALCTGRSKTGYTHAWRDPRFAAWKGRLMASTHGAAENALAWSLGWRTFRTLKDVSEVSPEEKLCPASPEGGHRQVCATCGVCNGRGEKDVRRSISIVLHGGPPTRASALLSLAN